MSRLVSEDRVQWISYQTKNRLGGSGGHLVIGEQGGPCMGFIQVIAEGLLFVASCFLEHKIVGSRFLSSCCFQGAQSLGEVQHSPCDAMSEPE